MGKITGIVKHITQKEYDDLGEQILKDASPESQVFHKMRGDIGYLTDHRNDLNMDEIMDTVTEYEKAKYLFAKTGDPKYEDDINRLYGYMMDDLYPGVEHWEKFVDDSRFILDEPMYVLSHNNMFQGRGPLQSNHHYSASVLDPEDIPLRTFDKIDEANMLYRLDPGQEVYHPMGLADNHETVVLGDELNKALNSGRGMPVEEYLNSMAKTGKAPFAVGAMPLSGLRAPQLDEIAAPMAYGSVSPIPQNPIGGAVSKGLGKVRDAANYAHVPEMIPLLGGLGLGDMLVGESPEVIEDWSYGFPPYSGSGEATKLDPRVMDIFGLMGL